MLDDEDFKVLELLRDSVEGKIVCHKHACFIDDVTVTHSHLIKFLRYTLVSDITDLEYGENDSFALNSTGYMVLNQSSETARMEALAGIAAAVAGNVSVMIENGRVIRF